MRSQMMGSIPSPNPRGASRMDGSRFPGMANPHDLIISVPVLSPGIGGLTAIGQKKRIEGLEEELRLTKLENEKNVSGANDMPIDL
jgi:hypothetical protein